MAGTWLRDHKEWLGKEFHIIAVGPRTGGCKLEAYDRAHGHAMISQQSIVPSVAVPILQLFKNAGSSF